MSEPNLLERSMEDGTWVRRTENMDEEGISFMEEVPKLRLEHINKDRVKMRPKRRPPSRAFVKSQASLDFDFVISEDIKEDEEEEEESTKVEHTDLHTEEANENLSDDSETPKTSPVKPTPPPKPLSKLNKKIPGPIEVNTEIANENHSDDAETPQTSPIKPTPPPKPLSKLNKKIPGPIEVNTEIANENHSDDAETPQTSPLKPTPPPKPLSKLNKKIPGPIEVNTEITNENLSDDGETPQTSPVKPARAPKPSGGWKLPSPTTGFKLRKTSEGEETKDDNEASDRITNAKERTSLSSSPEKKHRDFKLPFKSPFKKFRRSRRGKHENDVESDSSHNKTNLTKVNAKSMDSGLESRRRWPNGLHISERLQKFSDYLHKKLAHHPKKHDGYDIDLSDSEDETDAHESNSSPPKRNPKLKDDDKTPTEDMANVSDEATSNSDSDIQLNGKTGLKRNMPDDVKRKEQTSNENEAKNESVPNLKKSAF